MQINITKIVEMVIMLASALITTFLIPYLKNKLDAEKFKKIQTWVKIAVSAAEQIYNGIGQGEAKKDYVINFLAGKGYKIDADSLDSMIECAVHEMNHAITEE